MQAEPLQLGFHLWQPAGGTQSSPVHMDRGVCPAEALCGSEQYVTHEVFASNSWADVTCRECLEARNV